MRPARIGDVIEIPTAKGLAYAQITHKMPVYGHLIRVVEGIWRARPRALDEVVNTPTRFFTFFPVAAAVNQKIVSLAGNVSVPPQFADFPLMRKAGLEPPGGGKVDWWLWDGKEDWKIGSLTTEQRRLSIASVLNDTMLIHMIESDWRPETDIRTNRSDSPSPVAAQARPDAAAPQGIDWYLYFSSREQADRAASALRSDGFEVLVRPGATGGWLALAHTGSPATGDSFANLEARMRKLAESLNGEYDGWEAAVSP
jgi:hypothetical protein